MFTSKTGGINFAHKNALTSKIALQQGIHEIFCDLFRQYVICGGMPAVVKDYKDYTRYSLKSYVIIMMI